MYYRGKLYFLLIFTYILWSSHLFFYNSALDLTEGCFKYPLVEQYLKTKRFSRSLVVKYLTCRVLTLLILLLACLYLGYYIQLASLTDEFPCDLRTGVLQNDTRVPSAVQCKLVAVGVFRLLSYINLAVYVLLAPLVVYAALGPAHQGSGFLRPYEMLPGFGALGVVTPFYNDLSIYLLFLQENLSELKSFKCLQVGRSTNTKCPVWKLRFVIRVCFCFFTGAWIVARGWWGVWHHVPPANSGSGEDWCVRQ